MAEKKHTHIAHTNTNNCNSSIVSHFLVEIKFNLRLLCHSCSPLNNAQRHICHYDECIAPSRANSTATYKYRTTNKMEIRNFCIASFGSRWSMGFGTLFFGGKKNFHSFIWECNLITFFCFLSLSCPTWKCTAYIGDAITYENIYFHKLHLHRIKTEKCH